MDNEVRHTVEFGERTLSSIAALTEALKENNKISIDGNPEEFAREVCANIYADFLIATIFPYLRY